MSARATVPAVACRLLARYRLRSQTSLPLAKALISPQRRVSSSQPLTLDFCAHYHKRHVSQRNSRHYSTAPNDDEGSNFLKKPTVHENIYTIPNALTLSRIVACPVLGWSILDGNFTLATGLLAYAGITDWVDGYLARKLRMGSVLGSILDPAADKILMTTLTVTLAMKSMLPIPLAVIILGRDVFLGLSAFYIRYKTLPPPRTFSRYWDFSLPSAEVQPTQVSKINTLLQLVLMGSTTLSPLLSFDAGLMLRGLQWMVAGTTMWSGVEYAFFNTAFRVVNKNKPPK